jgi:lipid-A-disaccharide synthase
MTDPVVMLVAVEPSGDALGAALARALRRRMAGAVRFVGVGGPLMAAEGVRGSFDIAPLSVLGVFDALRIYPLVRRRAREVGELAARERPQAAVLIDSWGFNLRVARAIRRAAPKVTLIKYVAPQVWATRPGRARTLAGAVDRLLSIHAFDAPLFDAAGLPTTFVGNPVLAQAPVAANDGRSIHAPADDPLLVVAPGSRRGEVARLIGPFGDACRLLSGERPRLKIAVLAADAVREAVAAGVAAWNVPATLVTGEAERRGAMGSATVALACSGTVTTELALACAPMVVAYRLDALTYPIARALLQTRYITLLNVAAGREVAPEFVQAACTGPQLAAALATLLDDPAARARQIADQSAALEIMRGGIADPSGAAAEAVIAQLAVQRDSSGV